MHPISFASKLARRLDTVNYPHQLFVIAEIFGHSHDDAVAMRQTPCP
jgi:hypothetical protein